MIRVERKQDGKFNYIIESSHRMFEGIKYDMKANYHNLKFYHNPY